MLEKFDQLQTYMKVNTNDDKVIGKLEEIIIFVTMSIFARIRMKIY